MLLYIAIAMLLLAGIWSVALWISSSSPEKVKQCGHYLLYIIALMLILVFLRFGLPYLGLILGGILASIPTLSRLWQFFLLFQSVRKHRKHSGRTAPPSPHTGTLSEEEARRILGVSTTADRNEIKTAYQRLMKKNHPDAGGSVYLAERLNAAYAVLIKKKTRG